MLPAAARLVDLRRALAALVTAIAPRAPDTSVEVAGAPTHRADHDINSRIRAARFAMRPS